MTLIVNARCATFLLALALAITLVPTQGTHDVNLMFYYIFCYFFGTFAIYSCPFLFPFFVQFHEEFSIQWSWSSSLESPSPTQVPNSFSPSTSIPSPAVSKSSTDEWKILPANHWLYQVHLCCLSHSFFECVSELESLDCEWIPSRVISHDRDPLLAYPLGCRHVLLYCTDSILWVTCLNGSN